MSLHDKIVDWQELPKSLSALPRPLVFTNGVFDLLHPGHVTYLERARSLGASLVVGLNSDQSVRLLDKGDDRPVNHQADRAIMLASLASVSLVTVFNEKTPIKLIEAVHPDIYVKGGDYDMDVLEEAILVRSWGGHAEALQFLDGYSTTGLLHRVRSGSL